ncbi:MULTISPECIES: bifunctional diguanylate cyclase/phosphodiesterase [unclassified Nitratiruptor]|uniref:putative bifunctional diguanylate cyclase/phosphodiesterase n=1 Tax=unclassified Nitratiruptor TaxID=2624044 RepID=UPI001916AF02|nr:MULTISPECIES: bifunctional diguanylate cyclase/phosphodiesterase [unclassified Nitratiruptor]BCD59387.1 diguanylate cyclase/phosphodiesterase [Nitratiruptor sp. YY08-10]BCD63311.1 diguanylate cyclase/phosphodiesterase [Nitratiruptor sp. YY08-14]
MEIIKKEFAKKIEGLVPKETQKQLQLIADDMINKCVSFYTEREALVILDEKRDVIEIDGIFSQWFDISKAEVEGGSFVELFDLVYKSVIEDFLDALYHKGYASLKGIYLNLHNHRLFADLKGEVIEIDGKKYYLLFLKNKEFDTVNFKLNEIERATANLILRVKIFEPLIKELLKIFIHSGLFDFGWAAQVDLKRKKIIPLVVEGDSHIGQELMKQIYDFTAFKSILDVVIHKEDVITSEDLLSKDFKSQIIFPLKRKWEFDKSEQVAYLVLIASKQKIFLDEEKRNRLREVMYKINMAISEIMLQQKADLLLSTDPLTALPTRDFFFKEIDSNIEYEQHFAIVLIDVDKLRKVNDVMGFWAGDEVLKHLAHFLTKKLPDAIIARIGTDEFGIVIKGEKKEIYHALDMLEKFNEQYVKVHGKKLYVSISMGVAFYPEDRRKKESLFLLAEKALKEAKRKGGKQIEFANKNITFLPKDYLDLERELKEAVSKKEYLLYYQPIIDIHNGTVWGAEALLRWNSKKRGLVPPNVFISILEESGLINEVGELILDDICTTAKEFEDQELRIAFSMNLSVTQLLNRNMAREIIESVKRYKVKSRQLIVEITESVLMENVDRLKSQLEDLDRNGIQIEIDDFGTGYSSLSYLKHLPITNLKIDMEFIRSIPSDEEDRAIAEAIISMAKALKKGTIAEGVEQKEQLDILTDLGVDYIQGYYFAKPMPKEELKQFLDRFDMKNYIV